MYYYDQLLGRYAGSQDAIMDDNPLVKIQKLIAGAKPRGPCRPAFPCAIGDVDGGQETYLSFLMSMGLHPCTANPNLFWRPRPQRI